MTDTSTEAVERLSPYAVDGGCDAYGAMEEDEIGDYVAWEDYQALAAERDALRAENERLRELIEDKEYLSLKARYLSGMLSFANWIQERERPAPPQQGD